MINLLNTARRWVTRNQKLARPSPKIEYKPITFDRIELEQTFRSNDLIFHFSANGRRVGRVTTEASPLDRVLMVHFISSNTRGAGKAMIQWLLDRTNETIVPIKIIETGKRFWETAEKRWPERIDSRWQYSGYINHVNTYKPATSPTLYEPFVNVLNEQPSRFDQTFEKKPIIFKLTYHSDSQTFDIVSISARASEFYSALTALNQKVIKSKRCTKPNGQYHINIQGDECLIEFEPHNFTMRPNAPKPISKFYFSGVGKHTADFVAEGVSAAKLQKQLHELSTLTRSKSELNDFPPKVLAPSTPNTALPLLNNPQTTRAFNTLATLEACELTPLPYGTTSGLLAMSTPDHYYLWPFNESNPQVLNQLFQVNKTTCNTKPNEALDVGFFIKVNRTKEDVSMSLVDDSRSFKVINETLPGKVELAGFTDTRYTNLKTLNVASGIYPLPHKYSTQKDNWKGVVAAQNDTIAIIQDDNHQFFSISTQLLPAIELGDHIVSHDNVISHHHVSELNNDTKAVQKMHASKYGLTSVDRAKLESKLIENKGSSMPIAIKPVKPKRRS